MQMIQLWLKKIKLKSKKTEKKADKMIEMLKETHSREIEEIEEDKMENGEEEKIENGEEDKMVNGEEREEDQTPRIRRTTKKMMKVSMLSKTRVIIEEREEDEEEETSEEIEEMIEETIEVEREAAEVIEEEAAEVEVKDLLESKEISSKMAPLPLKNRLKTPMAMLKPITKTQSDVRPL